MCKPVRASPLHVAFGQCLITEIEDKWRQSGNGVGVGWGEGYWWKTQVLNVWGFARQFNLPDLTLTDMSRFPTVILNPATHSFSDRPLRLSNCVTALTGKASPVQPLQLWGERSRVPQSHTVQQTSHKRFTRKDTRGWLPLLRWEAARN